MLLSLPLPMWGNLGIVLRSSLSHLPHPVTWYCCQVLLKPISPPFLLLSWQTSFFTPQFISPLPRPHSVPAVTCRVELPVSASCLPGYDPHLHPQLGSGGIHHDPQHRPGNVYPQVLGLMTPRHPGPFAFYLSSPSLLFSLLHLQISLPHKKPSVLLFLLTSLHHQTF